MWMAEMVPKAPSENSILQDLQTSTYRKKESTFFCFMNLELDRDERRRPFYSPTLATLLQTIEMKVLFSPSEPVVPAVEQ